MSSADTKIMLGQNVEILLDKPRQDVASFGTLAFEARDTRQSGERLALICGRGLGPRMTAINSYKNLKSGQILKMVDSGIVDWTPENRQRLALIFEAIPKRKLLPQPDGQPFRISEDKIIPLLIHPVLQALSELRNVDIVHGAINPENIFLGNSEGTEPVVLGECISSAPSFRQHPLFETVERAMAQASGRGIGNFKEDLYAFGICVAMAAHGRNLMTGKTSEQIIQEKMKDGTYAVVAGHDRLPAGISEFLRGVLSDDDHQRWDISDALSWLEGRRINPKQARPKLNAARPFVLHEEKYWNLRSLAHVLAHNVTEAATIFDQDQFQLWIKRNFEDKSLLKRIDETHEREKASPKERLVSNLCMVLDPAAPLRYKSTSLFPSGLGTALADTVANGQDIQPYVEVLFHQLFSTWINLRFEEIPDAVGWSSLFEKCRNVLSQKMPGYGIERVLYILNKDTACLSPVLKDYFVLGPDTMLRALEKVARRGDRPENIFDRHMIAFLSVRDAKMIDPFLGHMTSPDKGNQIVGVLRVLASLQRRSGRLLVPGLTNWAFTMIEPAVKKFNDLDLQKMAMKQLEKVKDIGDVSKILEVVDDYDVVQDDNSRFAMARNEYRSLGAEKQRIETHLKKTKGFGQSTGRHIAMIVSSLLSTLLILGYIVLHVVKRFI